MTKKKKRKTRYDKAICDKCGKIGTVYWDNDKKEWHCWDCCDYRKNKL